MPSGANRQAMHLEMANIQTQHRTVLDLSNFHANVGTTHDYFTPRYLERGQ